MLLALDSTVNENKTYSAKIGDSLVITNDCYEQLSEFIKDLKDFVIN